MTGVDELAAAASDDDCFWLFLMAVGLWLFWWSSK
jgi:hypothetical protein